MNMPKIRQIRLRFALAVIALGLTACSSAPTRFYTLVGPEPANSEGSRAPFQIEVLSVDVPVQVQVPQLVIRTGDGQMERVETRRWIAPLADEIRSALSGDLSHDLGTRDVYGLTHGAGLKTYSVTVKVQRFDSVPGAYVRIDSIWAVHPSDDLKAGTTCSSSAQETVAPGYESLAQGHQQALASIALQIAASITAMQAGTSRPACPTGL